MLDTEGTMKILDFTRIKEAWITVISTVHLLNNDSQDI